MMLVLLLALVIVVSGQSTNICPPTFVDCSCGDDEYTIAIEMNTTSVIDEGTGMSRCVVEGDPLQICESRKCVIIPNDNFAILFQKGSIINPSNSLDESSTELDVPPPNVSQTEIEKASGDLDPLEPLVYPVQFTYPRSVRVTAGFLVRSKRHGRECRVPELRNSEVTCWKWPNWQTCKQKCIYGHGIKLGLRTSRSCTYTCRNSENRWKPTRFRDCHPYINCHVILISPGDLRCVEPGKGPAYCDIDCAAYGRNHHRRVRFVCSCCKPNRLPHCAALERNVHLISRP